MFSRNSCLTMSLGAYLLQHILGHQLSNQLGTMLLPLNENPTVYRAHRTGRGKLCTRKRLILKG